MEFVQGFLDAAPPSNAAPVADQRRLQYLAEAGFDGYSADAGWLAQSQALRPSRVNPIIFPSLAPADQQFLSGGWGRARRPALRQAIDPSIQTPWRP